MANNKINSENFNEKGYREERVNILENKYGTLEKSKIWESTGIKMEWIIPGYATAEAIGKFIGGNRDTVKNIQYKIKNLISI